MCMRNFKKDPTFFKSTQAPLDVRISSDDARGMLQDESENNKFFCKRLLHKYRVL
jgi:hypothetical protein